MTDKLRISAVDDWVTCEQMALSSPRLASRLHVAAYVGTLAHWYTTRHVTDVAAPHRPARLAFDATTPHIDHATQQAQTIAQTAKATLTKDGWQIIKAEQHVPSVDTTGVYDLMCWQPESRTSAIIDLKTGRIPSGVWLQVGGYLDNYGPDLEYGGVLIVPRVRVTRDQPGSLELRAADVLRDAWRRRLNRILDVQRKGGALPTPGQHCDRCALTGCPVRL